MLESLQVKFLKISNLVGKESKLTFSLAGKNSFSKTPCEQNSVGLALYSPLIYPFSLFSAFTLSSNYILLIGWPDLTLNSHPPGGNILNDERVLTTIQYGRNY